jgi:hypothetical protein
MKGTTAFVVAATLLSSVLAAPGVERRTISNPKTPPVTVKGNAFFVGNQRFYIRGVDYQPGGSSSTKDPLADANTCKRDIAEFQKLGINTIRVYTIDNSKVHDECMKALADAGIYLALDVNTPTYSLNRLDPTAIAISYNDVYLQSVFATVDMFAQYDNTLLFFGANEAINDDKTTFAAPYVKAVIRDIKAYIKARGYRTIPVGYSAADVESNRYEMATYLNCGNNRADCFAYNDYSWCDPSSYQISGWDKKTELFGNYSIPLFLSEYGCNTNKRKFEEVSALYSTQMTPVYSGGLVYEYSQEDNKYGLVQINGADIQELDDFTALQSAYKNTPNPSGDGGYKSDGAPSACPAASSSWNVTTTDLPAMPAGAQKYFQNGAGQGPGNNGDTGSQTAGTPSTGFGPDTAQSGSSSSTSSKSAAANVRIPELTATPFLAGFIIVASTLLGGMLL